MQKFGDIIKYKRTDLGLTQKELADMVGISQSAYSAYEKNILFPKLENRIKIAKALDIDVDTIYYLNEKQELYDLPASASPKTPTIDDWNKAYADNFYTNLNAKGWSYESLASMLNSFDFGKDFTQVDVENGLLDFSIFPHTAISAFSNLSTHGYVISQEEYDLLDKLRSLDESEQKIVVAMINRLYDGLILEMLQYGKTIDGNTKKMKIDTGYGAKLHERTWKKS